MPREFRGRGRWFLRSRRAFSIVGRAIAKGALRFRVRIVRFSIQGNHVHLIVEAPTPELLSRAMQGFLVRVARGLNRMMHRRGRVVSDRFHTHVLRSETRSALAYVRDNYKKHMAELGRHISPKYVDEYSSEAGKLTLPRARSRRSGRLGDSRARGVLRRSVLAFPKCDTGRRAKALRSHRALSVARACRW